MAWKTSRQISSFFSRLSALQKSKEAHPVTVEEEENLTEDDVSTWESHSFEQNVRYEVYEAVDLQHPLSFDDCWESAKKKAIRRRHRRVGEVLFL